MCLGRKNHPPEANIKLKEQIQYFQQSNEYAELSGIDGELVEFECNILQGFTSIEILRKIQIELKIRQINPDHFEGRIMFMTMFNDIDWTKSGNSDVYISHAREVSDNAKEFQRGHWSSHGLGDEEKWLVTHNCKL